VIGVDGQAPRPLSLPEADVDAALGPPREAFANPAEPIYVQLGTGVGALTLDPLVAVGSARLALAAGPEHDPRGCVVVGDCLPRHAPGNPQGEPGAGSLPQRMGEVTHGPIELRLHFRDVQSLLLKPPDE
jgi:hypothetical protein